jgi:hypothetical protein
VSRRSSRYAALAALALLAVTLVSTGYAQTISAGAWNRAKIVLRAADSAVYRGSGTSIVLNAPSGLAAGDVEIAQTWINATVSVTITPPAGWTAIRNDEVHATRYTDQYLFYHVAGTSEGSSYTFTSSNSGRGGGAIVAYTGVNKVTPVDASGCTGGTGTGSGFQNAYAPALTTKRFYDQLLFMGIDASETLTQTPYAQGLTQQWFNIAVSSTVMAGYDATLAAAGTTTAVTNLLPGGHMAIGCQVALAPSSTITVHSVGTIYNNETGGNPLASVLNAPPAITSGDILVAEVWFLSANPTYVPTVTPPSGWTQLRSDNASDGYNQFTNVIFTKVASGSEPSTYTFTADSGTPYLDGSGGVVIAYSGVNTSLPVDTSNCSVSYSPGTMPAITTTQANDKILYMIVMDGYLPNVLSNMTQQWFTNTTRFFIGADQALTTPGTVGANSYFQMTTFTADDYLACQLALRP